MVGDNVKVIEGCVYDAGSATRTTAPAASSSSNVLISKPV